MKSYSFAILSTVLVAIRVSAQLTINTPTTPAVCEPLQITFMGGLPPYFVSLHDGTDINGTPLISFPSTNSSPITWTVNYPVGRQLDLSIRDSNGAQAQSAIFTVVNGSAGTGCLNGTSTTPPTAGTTAAAPTTAGSTATAPANSGTSPTTGATKGTTTGSSASSPKASSTGSNAALSTGASYGAAGLIGAVVAAVFV